MIVRVADAHIEAATAWIDQRRRRPEARSSGPQSWADDVLVIAGAISPTRT